VTRHPTTQQSRACRILSAAYLEHAAGLRRTRWALDEILSHPGRAELDGAAEALERMGIAAENEVGRIEYQATLP
jgi:hypothetical protein